MIEVRIITGKPIRTWYESYDAQNRVIRIHPKTPRELGHIEIDPETKVAYRMAHANPIK